MRNINAALERWSKKVVKNTTAVEHKSAFHNALSPLLATSLQSTLPHNPPGATAWGETLLVLYHPSEGFTLWSCMVVRASVLILMMAGSCCDGYVGPWSKEWLLLAGNNNEYGKENEIPLQGMVYRGLGWWKGGWCFQQHWCMVRWFILLRLPGALFY